MRESIARVAARLIAAAVAATAQTVLHTNKVRVGGEKEREGSGGWAIK